MDFLVPSQQYSTASWLMEGGFHEWGGCSKEEKPGAVTDDGVSGLA